MEQVMQSDPFVTPPKPLFAYVSRSLIYTHLHLLTVFFRFLVCLDRLSRTNHARDSVAITDNESRIVAGQVVTNQHKLTSAKSMVCRACARHSVLVHAQ
jgi:hypothetical protein